MLAVLLVVMLVVVLLSCCCHCLCLLCCRIANTAATATVGMPPPLPWPLVSKDDDTCYMNADSSPAMLAQTVCQVLESQHTRTAINLSSCMSHNNNTVIDMTSRLHL
jgi:hypothetical protein